MTTPGQAVEAAFRREHGQVVASLIRSTGDWDLAEDCAQEAIARALERWPGDGVPERPGAWLTTVAHRLALDRLRREAVGTRKEQQAVERQAGVGASWPADDRLELVFTCCHPALPLENQVALTLRTLTGMSTAQIAAAFLVPEATMSRRLVRAKQKIREAGVPFRVPTGRALAGRSSAVLRVLYLVFNQGYGGDGALRAEALDLALLLTELMPDEPEALGLLALMRLHHARTPSRGADGTALVPLEEQDRSAWDAALVRSGLADLDRALAFGRPGPYQVQAAIASCHVRAQTVEATDWHRIEALYGLLGRLSPSPVVELNRAVAVAMAGRPAAALDLLGPLDAELHGYYLLPATRADLLRRTGRGEEAVTAYREAIALAPGARERTYLLRRLAEVS